MRRTAVVALSVLLPLIPSGGPAAAQSLRELTATPEATATLFLRSLRAIQWRTVARLLHPETLARFHQLVTTLCDADTTGVMRRYFTGTSEARAYATLDATTVFERSVGRTVDDLPGLMHSLYDHDDRVLGHVMEGADTAHVVYRTVERLSGAVPQVLVVQLGRTPDGWRVLWSSDLAVLEEALRGVRRAVKPDTSGVRDGTPGTGAAPARGRGGTVGLLRPYRGRRVANGREAESWVRGSAGRTRRTSL
jgi:hypothetical protein